MDNAFYKRQLPSKAFFMPDTVLSMPLFDAHG
jgi:hypothetical protein